MKKHISMDAMEDHKGRLAEWLRATGLRRSGASLKTAIGWKCKYTKPPGFDHTMVLYHPTEKAYVVITEPYAASPMDASFSVRTGLAGIQEASIIVCKRGTGIWNPPWCIPVIIGREKHGDLLLELAKALPSVKWSDA